jgi:hypothetical protein
MIYTDPRYEVTVIPPAGCEEISENYYKMTITGDITINVIALLIATP